MKSKRLFLLDVMPLLYRAHFATLGKQFATTTGIDTRTTLVFYNYIFQVLTEEKPDAVAAALDSRPKHRTDISASYKANRESMPAEISAAYPYAMRLLETLNIPVFKEEGFEADDVIGTLAKKAASDGFEVFIVSPDKDFAQLVNENIFLFRPAYKGTVMETLGVQGVIEKYGVRPDQIPDYLALRGDSVDNIPGIKGIGDKTAASLLADFNSVEELTSGADKIKQAKVRESVIGSREQLLENKKLATLTTDLNIDPDWNSLKTGRPDQAALVSLLGELQFVRIRERLERLKFIKGTKEQLPLPEKLKAEIRQIKPEELLSSLSGIETLAAGYNPALPDKLFLALPGNSSLLICEMKNREEWISVLRIIDSDRIRKKGWQLKPLLKKAAGLDIILQSSWTDISLGAYLLEPDAKIEWSYIRSKYELKEYQVQEPFHSLGYLLSVLEAEAIIARLLEEKELLRLFTDIELPLQHVLARMEQHGINIDLGALQEIEKALVWQISELEKELYELAGKEINLNSPGQIAEILEQMCLPAELTKTKTGQISTAESVLTDLASRYPFIENLLAYRKLNKIVTTYVTALPKYIDPVTSRIHPIFQQVVAGTGRLSCTDPNLQNLPVKSEAGREVRKAIVPSGNGFRILSIDYNQVELRLLAALSSDQVMMETFRSGKDIHTATACKIFNVSEGEVNKELRNKAKGVNFGIAYGITPWGLATRLRITQKEAKDIIAAYFEEFPSVKSYLESSIAESRERGYSRTRFGRIRYIEGINSPNGTTRKVAERIAVNAPIQGLAADIIKEAMVRVDALITEKNMRSRMILQVHDELVFDAAEDELDELVPELVRIMEAGGNLDVPLKVNVTIGDNWFEQYAYPVKV